MEDTPLNKEECCFLLLLYIAFCAFAGFLIPTVLGKKKLEFLIKIG